ncbi:MAG: hypothetical protein FJ134_11865 [Deltaproteobacteria bacterium]|nr:hypothetical protein [Deltaproteobacteria bacterium]
MNHDAAIELVRTLTREVVAQFRPAHLDLFADDFSHWASGAGAPLAAEGALRPREEGLDTTLVAGMFFRVLMDASRLPVSLPERVSFVRKEAKNYLVKHLSGQITLSQFYRLLNLIEENVLHYFQRQKADWLGSEMAPGEKRQLPDIPRAPQAEALRQALARVELPPKGRKLTRDKLEDFLLATQGRWFRVLDLERQFQVNKKTAWSCLHLFLEAGILEHNGAKANRARYALCQQFQPKPAPVRLEDL